MTPIFVDIAPRLDERSADQATGKLRDKFKGVGHAIGNAVGSDLGQELTREVGNALGGWDAVGASLLKCSLASRCHAGPVRAR